MSRTRVRSGMLAAVGWAYLGYAYVLNNDAVPGAIICPIRLMTGRGCPLCGMTRSWHAALHLDWGAAFKHHPVAPVLLPSAIGASSALLLHFLGAFGGGRQAVDADVIADGDDKGETFSRRTPVLDVNSLRRLCQAPFAHRSRSCGQH